MSLTCNFFIAYMVLIPCEVRISLSPWTALTSPVYAAHILMHYHTHTWTGAQWHINTECDRMSQNVTEYVITVENNVLQLAVISA